MEFDNSQTIFELIPDDKKTSGFRKYCRIILFVLCILLVIIITGGSFLAITSTRLRVKDFNELFNPGIKTNKNENFDYESSIFSLKKQEAFLKSRLTNSDLDSISLSINIPDSILSLEIKGVAIYNIRIDDISLSPFFNCVDKRALVNFFSSPFIIDYQYATVVKEPIVIKQAPKDTIEANQSAPSIDTLKPSMVAYYFYLDKDIILDIRQSEKTELIPLFNYSVQYNYWYTSRQLREILHLRIPSYLPCIQIKINCKDALAIFRALPRRANVSIKL